MSANLSNFELDNVEESSGMFINNPSLKIVDLGNCSDQCLNGYFIDSDGINKCKCSTNISCKYCSNSLSSHKALSIT